MRLDRIKGRVRATGLPRSVWVLTLNAFLVALGFGVMVPVLPVYAKSFGVDNFALGFVVASFALMRLVTSPFCGAINNLLGERNAITIGMSIVGASSVAMGLAQNFGQLLVFRALGGVGSAMFTVAALSLLLASAPEEMRGRASGIYQGGFLLGGMAGPAVGGALATISLTAPFYFYAGMLFVAATTVTVLLRGGRARVAPTEATGKRFSQVVTDVRYQAACLMSFGQGWQSFGVRNALVPIVVVEVLFQDPTWTGTAFAIAAVVQTLTLFPVGRIVDAVGRRPIMIIAGIVCGLTTLLIPFAPNIWWLVAILCGYGIGAAMMGTAPTATVGDVVGGRGGTAIAIYSMTSDVGSIVGPIAAGWLADQFSMPIAFAVGAAILISGSVYAAFMPRERPIRHAPASTEIPLEETGGGPIATARTVNPESRT